MCSCSLSVITQLPGGILATKYGGKWTLGLGLFITAIFAILTPVLARTHVHLLIMARVIQGLGEVRAMFFLSFLTKPFCRLLEVIIAF